MTPDDLKAFRSRWGLSLRALAVRIGYDHSMIALWESGRRPIPRRVGILLAAVFAAFIVFVPFRRQRFFAYLEPFASGNAEGSGYQLTHSLMAIGKGEWFGVGLGGGVAKWSYLPEPHTDFIFAIIGEELGLIGCLFVVALFATLIGLGLRIAHRASDPFGAMLAVARPELFREGDNASPSLFRGRDHVRIDRMLVGGQRVMRWWLTLVARRKSEELFVLNLLLVLAGLTQGASVLDALAWSVIPVILLFYLFTPTKNNALRSA